MNTWKTDIATGTASIVFAGFMLVYSLRFPPPRGADFGPSLFPRVIATILVLLGVLLLIQSWRSRNRQESCEPDPLDEQLTPTVAGLRNVAITIVAITVYIAVIGTVGFIPTTLVMLFVLMKAYGLSVLKSILFSALITGFVYVLFAMLLRVVLP